MSIATTDRKAGPFLGDDVTTEFPFDFKVYDAEHLKVILTSSAGVESELTLDTDYTVSLNADQDSDPGGSITYPVSGDPLATGEKLTIITDQPATQEAVLNNMGGFFPKTIEKRLDWLTILVQQAEEKFGRALLGAISDSAPDFALGTAAARANKFLAFDSAGNVSLASSVVTSSAEIVHFDAPGDGVTDVTTELQAALNSAAGSARLHLPAGTYIVSATIRVPSGTHLYGDGMGRTIIKMAGTVGRNTTVVQTGAVADPRTDIVIEDLTIDANEDRWSVSGGTEVGTSSTACALAIVYTERCVVQRVEAKNAHSHGIDVAASQQSSGPTSYTGAEEISRYVWILNCRASNCGDDNITTHFCSDVWITGCYSVDPSGARVPGNSNCFEIDDGSRNIFLTDNLAVGGDCGLQIKGHNDQPAPYNVHVNGLRAVNNRIGVEIRHSGWYSATDTDLADETLDENGDPFEFTGASPNARNLILNNITISRPTNRTPNGTPGEAVYGFRLRSYENVIVNNLVITDGTLDAPDDYDDFDTITNNLIRIYSGARHVMMRNVSIYGFSGITPSGTAAFWCTSSLAGPLLVDGLTAIDGPSEIFRCSSGAGPIHLKNYYILGDHSSTKAVIVSDSTGKKRVGDGVISGYLLSSPDVSSESLGEVRNEARSSGGADTTPQTFLTWVWEEGDRDLGAGEGMKWSFKCNLVSNNAGAQYNGVDYEFGNFQWRKSNGLDDSVPHDFAIQMVSATDGSPPSDVLVIDAASGGVRLHRELRNENNSVTLTLRDMNLMLRAVNASPTYTIDTNENEPFPVGAEIHLVHTGSGTTTIAAVSGVNLFRFNTGGAADGGDGASVTLATGNRARLFKYDTNSWFIEGGGLAVV